VRRANGCGNVSSRGAWYRARCERNVESTAAVGGAPIALCCRGRDFPRDPLPTTTATMKILVIEDNRQLVANIFEYFEGRGHTMDAAPDGRTGLHLAARQRYDAIVLDLGLPALDGLELCRRLRVEASLETPILMLTARDALEDKLRGFRVGASDFLIKPVALAELEARIGALVRLRAGESGAAKKLQVADLTYDTETRELRRGGRQITLNPTARRILAILMREAPRLVTSERLTGEIWGDEAPTSDTLRAHIYTIRAAIDRPFAVKLLKTVHSEGYRLCEDEDGDAPE
jgi:DNA-binding response OmpR family regulator